MGVKRNRIPDRIAAEVTVASARCCCVCKSPGVHLHHIDGDPANNAKLNLTLLCFSCHDDATRSGGLKRKLSVQELKRFRHQWYEEVAKHGVAWANSLNKSNLATFSREDARSLMLEAIAIDSIRDFEANWRESQGQSLVAGLRDLLRFTDFRNGPAVRAELLWALSSVEDGVRFGMLSDAVSMIAEVARAALPIFSLVRRRPGPTTPEEQELLLRTCDLGFSLAYDAMRYLGDLASAEQGIGLLWAVLRFAELNGLQEVKKEALEEFGRLRDTAEKDAAESICPQALEWLEYRRADALAIRDEDAPKLPQALFDLVHPTRTTEDRR